MKSIFLIIFNTKRTLEYLDNQDEVNLNIKSIFLFFFYGMIVFFLKIDVNTILINPYLDFVLIVFVFIFFGVLFSLILHKINMWLSGNGSYADIQSVISHTSVPITISLIIVFFSKRFFFKDLDFNWNMIFYIGWLIAMKIIIQGFFKYNNSSYIKTIINLIPLILFYIGLLLIRLN